MNTAYKKTARNWILLILGILVGVVGLLRLNFLFAVRYPGGKDFLARWMGARMWLMEGISPYDERVSLATQEEIYGRPADPEQGEDENHFVYPLTSMFFFGPFGLLEYEQARAVWMTVLEISLVVLTLISLRLAKWKASLLETFGLVFFSLIWYHSLRSVIIGQFSIINSLLIVGAIWAVYQDRDSLGGVLLAFSIAKPQMVVLIIPYVLLWALSRKRMQVIWGFLISLAIQMAITLALIPDWPLQMLRQVLDYPSYTYTGSPLTLVAEAVPGLKTQVNWTLHVIFGLYLLLEWGLSWGKDRQWFLWTAFMTLVMSNVLAFYGLATTNYVMLLPVIFLVAKIFIKRWGKPARRGVWAFLVVMAVGLWGLFGQVMAGNIGHDLYWPVLIVCLLGLWWVRWWAIDPMRLSLIVEEETR